MASPINKLIGANLRHHASRYVSTAIAVTIASTFVVLCLTLVGSVTDQYLATVEDETKGSSVVIAQGATDEIPESAATADQQKDLQSRLESAVESLNDVERVDASTSYVYKSGDDDYQATTGAYAAISKGDNQTLRTIAFTQTAPLATSEYHSGRAPQSKDEIAIDANAAQSLDAHVGDSITVDYYGNDDGVSFTISGIIVASKFENQSLQVTPEGAQRISENGLVSSYKVIARDSALRSPNSTVSAQEKLQKEVNTALESINNDAKTYGITYTAYTSQKILESGRRNVQTAVTGMTVTALIFPLIAAFVAAIIVGTTFQVIALQRRRELALLRAVGAQSRQVRTLIFRETSAAGIVSSLIGATVGSAVGAALLVYLGVATNFFTAFAHLPWMSIILTFIVSSIITTFVGIAPARKASSISPLAALSPVQTVQEERRSHTIRIIIGVILLVASIAGIIYGLKLPSETDTEIYARFGIVVLSVFVCWIAAMMIFTVALPYIIYGVGSILRTPVGRLARGNVVRNPGRTASTGIAVIIGVVFMSTISVGVASVQTTIDSTLNENFPIDIEATSLSGNLGDAELKNLQEFKYATQTKVVYGATAIVDNNTSEMVSVLGYPDVSTIARSDMKQIENGTVHVNTSDSLAKKSSVNLCFVPSSMSDAAAQTADSQTADAQTFDSSSDAYSAQTDAQALTSALTCRDFTVVKDGNVTMGTARISDQDLKADVSNAQPVSVIMRIRDNAQMEDVMSELGKIGEKVNISGGFIQRSVFTQILNVIVTVFLVLLGVSVVISLVGVANTLGLSVAERTQENGLLRALGLTRGQMRRLLVTEAFLTSVVSTLVGIGLGIIFAVIGMYTLPFGDMADVMITIPYGQLGTLLAVIVLASVVAAWLPGRQAAKVSPVEALASE
ncbi:ABC transporter permease [Alloscardovia criceti]|uniref:ABC transporter permease n=1 Tax=Alloscardovia criceti TaxID=356828 RepID=UPI000371FF47|nr:ABC transporter permease [Alloscardovia criceti]